MVAAEKCQARQRNELTPVVIRVRHESFSTFAGFILDYNDRADSTGIRTNDCLQ
jgi:hypothetical protein